jgi:hypothetical protein
MRVLSLAPLHNSPGKRDATGAFQPEARAFTRLGADGSVYRIVDNSANSAKMRGVTGTSIRLARPGVIGFFCHGWRTGIQFGWNLDSIDTLASVIAEACPTDAPIVALYACSTASGGVGGDGGFADQLRDALCKAGAVNCRVDAHDRSGHCTRNPYVRRFEGQGSTVGSTGGLWIVQPGTSPWKPWVRALRETDLRLRFPMMSIAEIHKELTA